MRHDYSPIQSGIGFPALTPVTGGDSLRTVMPHTSVCARLREAPSASATCDSSVNTRDSIGIAAIIRAQTARDFLAALAEWQRASGTDRAYWRRYVRMYVREERARLAASRAALHAAATRNRRNAA